MHGWAGREQACGGIDFSVREGADQELHGSRAWCPLLGGASCCRSRAGVGVCFSLLGLRKATAVCRSAGEDPVRSPSVKKRTIYIVVSVYSSHVRVRGCRCDFVFIGRQGPPRRLSRAFAYTCAASLLSRPCSVARRGYRCFASEQYKPGARALHWCSKQSTAAVVRADCATWGIETVSAA